MLYLKSKGTQTKGFSRGASGRHPFLHFFPPRFLANYTMPSSVTCCVCLGTFHEDKKHNFAHCACDHFVCIACALRMLKTYQFGTPHTLLRENFSHPCPGCSAGTNATCRPRCTLSIDTMFNTVLPSGYSRTPEVLTFAVALLRKAWYASAVKTRFESQSSIPTDAMDVHVKNLRRILMLCCPRGCPMPEDHDACTALRCSGCCTPFCALCMEVLTFNAREAHAHATVCKYAKDKTVGPFMQMNDVLTARKECRKDRFSSYWNTLSEATKTALYPKMFDIWHEFMPKEALPAGMERPPEPSWEGLLGMQASDEVSSTPAQATSESIPSHRTV